MKPNLNHIFNEMMNIFWGLGLYLMFDEIEPTKLVPLVLITIATIDNPLKSIIKIFIVK